jgi:DNA-binding NtrC family response regulator
MVAMPERSLHNCRVLIAEDEFMVAESLRHELEDTGAIIIGPCATLEQTLAEIASDDQKIDGAVLDVNLAEHAVYPAADMLAARGIPFIFTTGYDANNLPARFAGIPRCEKPISMSRVVRAVGRAMHSEARRP